MGKFEKLNNELNKYLRLATFPVGVSLLKSSEEFKNINFLKKPENKIAICQIFS